MIDPEAITTYAQYNEDIILLALLHDVKKGFYVDVGANYAIEDSVTKLFYEKGWRGINIEPVRSLYLELKKQRPEDINLNYGAGSEVGKSILREYTKVPGHSTFNDYQKESEKLEFKEYEVEILPLKDILAKNKVEHIHFLKIDVEGYEYEVVKGNDWARFRPEVICIEANHQYDDWRPTITKNKYKLFIADGLNEYYLAEEAWPRTERFANRAIKLDAHALKLHQKKSWSRDSEEVARLRELLQQQQQENDHMSAQLSRAASLSLKDQPLPRRIKRSVYGLTVDWVRYKKRAKK